MQGFEKFFNQFPSPSHSKGEFKELINFLEELKPRVILEIGTHRGGTFKFFARIIPKDGLLIGIEPDRDHLSSRYPLPKKEIHLVRGFSWEGEVLGEVKKILGKRRIDFLYIDADHRYRRVKEDFELYSPLLSKTGVIGFHDIRTPKKEKYQSFGVKCFFDEVRKGSKSKEILFGKDYEGSDGIGLLFKEEKKE